MNNRTNSANANPSFANFNRVLAAKPWLRREIFDRLQSYSAEYAVIADEMKKWERTAAEAHIAAVRKAATDNPTAENLKALVELGEPNVVRRKFEACYDELAEVRRSFLTRAGRPLCTAIWENLRPLIDAEIERAERLAREEHQRLAIPYNPDDVVTVRSLKRWRFFALTKLTNDTAIMTPSDLTSFLGKLEPVS